jgi:cell wall-associated NlpC family hydrolase
VTAPDRRLHAWRPDLADERLKGRVEAGRFAAGWPARVAVPVLDLYRDPRPDAGLDTQLLRGDEVTVFEEAEGWAWLQSRHDGYVGYASAAALAAAGDAPTHVAAVPRTFSYRDADMKSGATAAFSLGSRIAAVGHTTTRGTDYLVLAGGEAVIAAHFRPLDKCDRDYVAVAETLERTPYLWGGASAFGIDCSGLVQLSMRMAGRAVLRDTDMQAASIGDPVLPGPNLSGLRRGDLVFWEGHVAIMVDADGIVHANGHAMAVSREPLRDAVARIAYLYGEPTVFRRP